MLSTKLLAYSQKLTLTRHGLVQQKLWMVMAAGTYMCSSLQVRILITLMFFLDT